MKTSIQKYNILIILILSLSFKITAQDDSFTAIKTSTAVTIDGVADEPIWEVCEWDTLKYVWIPYGTSVSADDFTGKFKLAWDENLLYLLVEVIDDSLYDGHVDPLTNYWDDDCVEVFLDEDHSGGNHLNNFNAFAYHVGIFLDAVDNTTAGTGLFNDDIDVKYTKNGNIYTWELAIKVFDDTYIYNATNAPIELTHGKVMGFSLAYCDNDGSVSRENFIGSKYLPEAQANNGYINADVFGTLTLFDSTHVTSLKIDDIGTEKIYPTLFNDRLLLKLNNDANYPVEITITDVAGIRHYCSKVSATEDEILVDTKNLASGSYVITVLGRNTRLVSEIIKF